MKIISIITSFLTDVYSDIDNIIDKIALTSMGGNTTHTFRELCKHRDHLNTCNIVRANMMHELPGELCIE